MKLRHFLSTIFTLIAAYIAISVVTAQTEDISEETAEEQHLQLGFFTSQVIGVIDGEEFLISGESLSGEEQKLIFLAHLENAIEGDIHWQHMKTVTESDSGFSLNVQRNGESTVLSLEIIETPLTSVLEPIARLLSVITINITAEESITTESHENVSKKSVGFFTVDASSLTIEDPAAYDVVVTASGENLSPQEALDLIAEASNCNIFQDGDKIVVDYCG